MLLKLLDNIHNCQDNLIINSHSLVKEMLNHMVNKDTIHSSHKICQYMVKDLVSQICNLAMVNLQCSLVMDNLKCSRAMDNLQCSQDMDNLKCSQAMDNLLFNLNMDNLQYSQDTDNLQCSNNMDNNSSSQAMVSLQFNQVLDSLLCSKIMDSHQSNKTLEVLIKVMVSQDMEYLLCSSKDFHLFNLFQVNMDINNNIMHQCKDTNQKHTA